MYITKKEKISIYKGLYKLMLMVYNNPKYSEMVHTVDMQEELPEFDKAFETYKYQHCKTDMFGNKVINVDKYDIEFTKYQVENMAKHAIIRLQNTLRCNKIRLYQRYRYGLNFGEIFLLNNPELALLNDTELNDYLNNSESTSNFSIKNDRQNVFDYFRNNGIHKYCDFRLSSEDKYTGKVELEPHISREKIDKFFKYYMCIYSDKKFYKPFTFTDKTLTVFNYRYFKDNEIIIEDSKNSKVKKTDKCHEIYPFSKLTNGERHYADIKVMDSEYDKFINFIKLIAPDNPKTVSNSYAIQSEFIRASRIIDRFFNYHKYTQYDKDYKPSEHEKTGQQLAFDLWQSWYRPEIRWLLRLDSIENTNYYFDLSTMLTFTEMQYAFSGLDLFDIDIREQIYKQDNEYSKNIETIKKFNDSVKTKYKDIRYELFKYSTKL